jgi:hypothetical protein
MEKTTKLEIISLFILLMLLFGCSASKNSTSDENDKTGTNFVTGQILMVNNEPFARIALITDKSLYLLDCPEEMRDALYHNQGRTARIYYKNYTVNDESIRVLKVEKAEIMSGN